MTSVSNAKVSYRDSSCTVVVVLITIPNILLLLRPISINHHRIYLLFYYIIYILNTYCTLLYILCLFYLLVIQCNSNIIYYTLSMLSYHCISRQIGAIKKATVDCIYYISSDDIYYQFY